MDYTPIPVHDLYWLRTARHLTGAQVAAQVGCSRTSYYLWETGRAAPRYRWLRKLSRVLGVQPSRLVAPTGEERDAVDK